MRNICKIQIHPFCYIVALIYVVTGMFRPFFWIMSLIVVHECGHILMGLFFHWNIEKVVLMPMGGITIFKEALNRPIVEEFLIAFMGPFFQVVFFLLLRSKVPYPWFSKANTALLLFNLLPMVPLDGSKLLHCLCDVIFPFERSHRIVLHVSFLLLISFGVFCIRFQNLILCIVIFCMTLKIIEEWKDASIRFDKFLLERYLYPYHFRKKKKIKGADLFKMHRDCAHVFFINSHWVSEKSVLKNHFG